MIEYIYDEDERLVSWAAAMLGRGHRLRDDAKAIGVQYDGELRGAIVFDTFSHNDCLMTVVSDSSRRWVTRELMIRVMAYPFIQLEFPRISCLVSVNNKESRRLTHRFGGWKLEGVLREAGVDGEDLLLFGMLKRDCPHLPLLQVPIAV